MYNRTQNDNGTYNTRCLYCFMTVASAVENEDALGALEAQHMCTERALTSLMTDTQAAKASAQRG